MDSVPKSLNPNKQLREQFVSNLAGASFFKIFLLLAIIPFLFLLRQSFNFSRPTDASATKKTSKKDDDLVIVSKNLTAHVSTISVDFVFIVLPMLLFFTILSEWTFLGFILWLSVVFSIACKRQMSFGCYFPYFKEEPHSFRNIISSYRVATMIMTCLCILAVDFKIFPRENAKTETYGTSLMDLGVGTFVVANAVVSRQARNISSTNWKTALKSASPLILLGFGRIAFTSGVDYQVHVGEYGVHWNFFFTLGGVSILTSVISIPPRYCGILGSVILIGYQSLLVRGLNVYLISKERGTDLISLNKEGIFSMFGYWGLYLISVQLSYYLFFSSRSSSTGRSNKAAFFKAWILSFVFWAITLLLDWHVEKVSRRMCNMPYVTWVVALNLQLLGALMFCDYIPRTKISTLEEALDQNMLATFVLANLLTGLVNLSIETLFVSPISALLILAGYAFTFSMIIGIVYFYGIRLKFW